MRALENLTPCHFIQMYELEQKYYAETFITPYEEAYRWYQRFPYTTFAVAEGDQIIGFINLFPIQRAIFRQIKQGNFNDKELTVADIVDLSEPDQEAIPMFLSCIVVADAWRKKGVTDFLLRTAVDYYRTYAARFDVIVTDNLTVEGQRFSKRYSFKPLTTSQHDSQLFIQTYASFQKNVLST